MCILFSILGAHTSLTITKSMSDFLFLSVEGVQMHWAPRRLRGQQRGGWKQPPGALDLLPWSLGTERAPPILKRGQPLRLLRAIMSEEDTVGADEGWVGGPTPAFALAGLISLHPVELHFNELSAANQRDKLLRPLQVQCGRDGRGALPPSHKQPVQSVRCNEVNSLRRCSPLTRLPELGGQQKWPQQPVIYGR